MLFFRRRQDHREKPPFLPRGLLDLRAAPHQSQHFIQHRPAHLLVRHLAATEHHGDLGLVPIGQEPLHLAHLRLQVGLNGARSQLVFLEMRTLVVLLGGVGFLAQLILVLAEVHDLTDRRLSRRRDLDKIVSQFFRFLQGINRRHDAELFALRTDDAYWRYSDLSIDPQFWNGDRAPLSFRFMSWVRRWSALGPPPLSVNAPGRPLPSSRLHCPRRESARRPCRPAFRGPRRRACRESWPALPPGSSSRSFRCAGPLRHEPRPRSGDAPHPAHSPRAYP